MLYYKCKIRIYISILLVAHFMITYFFFDVNMMSIFLCKKLPKG